MPTKPQLCNFPIVQQLCHSCSFEAMCDPCDPWPVKGSQGPHSNGWILTTTKILVTTNFPYLFCYFSFIIFSGNCEVFFFCDNKISRRSAEHFADNNGGDEHVEPEHFNRCNDLHTSGRHAASGRSLPAGGHYTHSFSKCSSSFFSLSPFGFSVTKPACYRSLFLCLSP